MFRNLLLSYFFCSRYNVFYSLKKVASSYTRSSNRDKRDSGVRSVKNPRNRGGDFSPSLPLRSLEVPTMIETLTSYPSLELETLKDVPSNQQETTILLLN